MNITYQTNKTPTVEEIIAVYESSTINRPIQDVTRIQKMYDQSNLIVTAWDGDELVGVARSLTDFCYCCYRQTGLNCARIITLLFAQAQT